MSLRAVEPMAPPFATRGQALGFCAVVAFILLLPAAFRRTHAPTHEQRMATAPVRAGPYSFLHEQIYEKTSDLDLAIVGDSQIWAALDAPAVSDALTRKLGRQARVVSLGWNWHGDDLTFYVLRDLLERRKVGVVLLRLPREGDRVKGPHPQSFRWFTSWDDPVEPGMSRADRAAFYGIEATGSLRNLLSLLRPDRLAPPPEEERLGAYLAEIGPDGRPFKRLALQPPPLGTRVLSTFGASPALAWGGDRPSSSAIAWGYASAIHDLLTKYGVRAAFVRIPMSNEVKADELRSDAMWRDIFGAETPVLAAKPRELFEGLTDDDTQELYYELSHLNRNGAELFTLTLLPGLLELWSNAPHGS
jgi:hypothetical protein